MFLTYRLRPLLRQLLIELRRADVVGVSLDLEHRVASGEDEIIRVHEALEELAAVDMRVVRVVEMRYFAGLSEEEVAAALGVTARTVRRDWEKARMLLAAALK